MLTPYQAPNWAQELHMEYTATNALDMKEGSINDYVSDDNVNMINNELINLVYNKSQGKFKIQLQNIIALKTIMYEINDMNRFQTKKQFNDFVLDNASNNIITNIKYSLTYSNENKDNVSLRNTNWKNTIDLPQNVNRISKELQYNDFH